MNEYEQLNLWEDYEPKVNDYVIWDKHEYGKDEDRRCEGCTGYQASGQSQDSP